MTAAEKAPRPPGRPRSAETDAAILEAAAEELIERGFIAATMESIAARAGVAKTTVYRRFANTADLALAVMRSFEEGAPEPPEGSVRNQLVHLGDIMRRSWGDPRYAALMRRVAADGTVQPELYKACRDRLIGPFVRSMNAVIRRGMDEGLIRPDVDVEWVRQLLAGPIMAAALTHKERITRAQLELTVDTILAGLTPR